MGIFTKVMGYVDRVDSGALSHAVAVFDLKDQGESSDAYTDYPSCDGRGIAWRRDKMGAKSRYWCLSIGANARPLC
jgi:hypothetical protein